MRLHTLKELDSSEGTVQLHASASDKTIILHPTPSATDPNDPLRWPRWRKHVAFAAVCGFTFFSNYGIGGLSPAFYILSLEFGKTQTQTTALLLWPILVFGLFNFFWVPIANYFGKRPVFVFANLLLGLCYIWGATAKSFESLLWSNIVAAFAGSATEALGAAMVNDLYFLHERAGMMGIYMNAISGGNTVGPLICGFVVESLGWRWHKWMAAIFTLANWLVVLFFVAEPRYSRNFNEGDVPSTTGSMASIPNSDEEIASSMAEKQINDETAKEVQAREQMPLKTWWQRMSLWSGVPKDGNLALMFIRPLPLISYPAVIFAFLGYAVSLAWVVAINILNSFILQAPPYNWSPAINGLINIPGLLGNIVGAILGGWLVDKYSDWKSKKHGGTFVPESRLTLLIFPAILVPAGCLLFGYGVANVMNWATLFFGYGMVAVGLTAVPIITMTYVSDCYLPVAPDALLLINGLKNVVAFGFLYGVVPWISEDGYVDAFGTQAGVYVAIVALAIPLSFFGARIRHKTALWRIIL